MYAIVCVFERECDRNRECVCIGERESDSGKSECVYRRSRFSSISRVSRGSYSTRVPTITRWARRSLR